MKQSQRIALVLVSTVLLLATNHARATLIDAGDITLDDSTDLAWLDVTLTAGLSVEEVLAGTYIADGFRYATQNEVVTLFLNADNPCSLPSQCGSFGTFTPQNHSPVRQLQLLIGITQMSSSLWETYAFLGLDEPGSGDVYLSQLLSRATFSQGALSTIDSLIRSQSESDPKYGSFLVRSIPEPSTVTLIGIGILGLVVMSRARPLR